VYEGEERERSYSRLRVSNMESSERSAERGEWRAEGADRAKSPVRSARLLLLCA
jgi:hypothetical protein